MNRSRCSQLNSLPTVEFGLRTGFTLWELLLVLAILSTVIALSLPALNRLLEEDRMQQALGLLQGRFGAARIQAMERQTPYQFRFEPGGRRFVFLPAYLPENASQTDAANSVQRPWVAAVELPEKTRLELSSLQTTTSSSSSTSETSTASNSPTFELPLELFSDVPNASRFQGVTWSSPILIRPDGTATTFEILLCDEKDREIKLLVRGITGSLIVRGLAGGGGS